jgi:hypothetical protein
MTELPLHFPKAAIPIPDLDAHSVIFSDSEEGYWSNEDGWVADLRCATVFRNIEIPLLNLPMSASDDAFWMTLRQAVALGAS